MKSEWVIKTSKWKSDKPYHLIHLKGCGNGNDALCGEYKTLKEAKLAKEKMTEYLKEK